MKLHYSTNYCLLILTMLFANFGYAQDATPLDHALRFLENNREEFQLTTDDISSYEVNDVYLSKHNKVVHVYLKQRHQNIGLNNGLININVLPNGEVLNYGNRFVSDLKNKVNSITPTTSPEQAIQKVIEYFEINVASTPQLISSKSLNKFVFSNEGLALAPINVDLVYEKINEDEVKLAWMVQFQQLDAQHWWNARIDALTGEMIDHNDQMLHCNFGAPEGEGTCIDTHHNHANHTQKRNLPEIAPVNFLNNGSYNVYPLPIQAPTFGDRALVASPADPVASPFGWHDTNGVDGPEFTITRGNNTHTYHDIFAQNASAGDEPDGGPLLNFDYPLDLSTRRPYTQVEPAVTNLFFWTNVLHDISYIYGFDEASGNFQVNNYGNGGIAQDEVFAEALDGSGTNNAVFGTGADGSNARMQMFLWTNENLPEFPVELVVTGPDTIANETFAMTPAGFGGDLTTPGITASVILADDGIAPASDLCEDVVNGAELEGNIAMIDRGNCEFGAKVLAAEQAGAVAVIICNNVDNPATIVMAPGAVGNQVTIPAVMISLQDCNELKLFLDDNLSVTLAEPELVIPGPGPNALDGDFDNGIIAHEYGHGISIRLTGGPSTGGCLNNDEQAGEGWSDWFGMVLTTDRNNNANERRGVGTYAVGQATTARGIRSFPYSRNMSINPDTYGVIQTTTQVHRVGSVWCATIWDMYWDLIDEYGFDDDVYNGTGGNNIAFQLVMDGLKLQPCNPTFVESRDAILAADRANNNGINECLIWETFARRGLGASARDGGLEAFDLPAACDVSSTYSPQNKALDISIFPNPNNGSFNIIINEEFNGPIQTSVISVDGKLISTQEHEGLNSRIEMNLSEVPSGVYFVEIQTDETTVIRKILVD